MKIQSFFIYFDPFQVWKWWIFKQKQLFWVSAFEFLHSLADIVGFLDCSLEFFLEHLNARLLFLQSLCKLDLFKPFLLALRALEQVVVVWRDQLKVYVLQEAGNGSGKQRIVDLRRKQSGKQGKRERKQVLACLLHREAKLVLFKLGFRLQDEEFVVRLEYLQQS